MAPAFAVDRTSFLGVGTLGSPFHALPPVGVATVSDSRDDDALNGVVHAIYDPVLPDADSIQPVGQLLDLPAWTRIVGERVDAGLDTALSFRVQRVEILNSAARQFDAVRQPKDS